MDYKKDEEDGAAASTFSSLARSPGFLHCGPAAHVRRRAAAVCCAPAACALQWRMSARKREKERERLVPFFSLSSLFSFLSLFSSLSLSSVLSFSLSLSLFYRRRHSLVSLCRCVRRGALPLLGCPLCVHCHGLPFPLYALFPLFLSLSLFITHTHTNTHTHTHTHLLSPSPPPMRCSPLVSQAIFTALSSPISPFCPSHHPPPQASATPLWGWTRRP